MKTTIPLAWMLCLVISNSSAQTRILQAASFRHYFDSFNETDNELYKGSIENDRSGDFLSDNIPLFDCPDKDMERTYYFRWWTYRKHIKRTREGYVITEFLPDVPWAGKFNTISCAAGHHFYEGRWLRDKRYLTDYANFWFHEGSEPRKYSFWISDAIYNFCMISGDFKLADNLLPGLIRNYEGWEKTNLDSTGLFWQTDDRDGMEESICGEDDHGQGYRATLNSYMYGDAIAIAKIARLSDKKAIALRFELKAQLIKANLQKKLWDRDAAFFKVLPRDPHVTLCSARELHGYTPWYFNLPDPEYAKSWKFLMDTAYFFAPYGLTSAEQHHPGFRILYKGHECQWNGPSWPYATSITLTALANLLNRYPQDYISKEDYFRLLKIYTNSQQLKRADGKVIPWIDENLNPFTGDWISRTRLQTWENGSWSPDKGGVERGKDYNHSTYCDLIISGLMGIRPQEDNILLINPLVPDNTWSYFCLDKIFYHGKELTILYDRTGDRYKIGKGFFVLVNGRKTTYAKSIRKVQVRL